MYGPYVWNSLRRLGAPTADLEDLTHDVFVQVQRRIADYDPARPVRPWLFAFAYHIASAHRRRAHRRREVLGEPDGEPHPGLLPDEALGVQERQRLVARALGAIDIDRRAVFVLYEIDGVPMEEIGRALDIPTNTAYSRLRTARAEFASAVRRLSAKPVLVPRSVPRNEEPDR
jgi:RNA polymerase sigma-70 factor (ECF subfamily)